MILRTKAKKSNIMGYSKIEINFTDVPFHDDILYITESKLGLNLNVLFRDNRSVARK
jgi:hypothetical protein